MRLILIIYLLFNQVKAQSSDFSHVDFTRAENRAKRHKGESLKNIPLLAYNLTNELSTDVEKFRAIYYWVCHNISGDPNQHDKVDRKQIKYKNDSLSYVRWSNDYMQTAMKKLILYRRTMCTGYAILIRELCVLSGLECEVIDGYARTVDSNVESLQHVNHSWNAVNLNGKWYLSDATWSSGYMLNSTHFIRSYNNGYFLTEPSLFAMSHYPIDKKWLLKEDLISSDFKVTPIVYAETYEHNVLPILPETLHIDTETRKEIDFVLRNLNNTVKKAVTLVYYSGNREKKIEVFELANNRDKITFKCMFEKPGIYDVHLKLEQDIVASYTIEVRDNLK